MDKNKLTFELYDLKNKIVHQVKSGGKTKKLRSNLLTSIKCDVVVLLLTVAIWHRKPTTEPRHEALPCQNSKNLNTRTND